MQEATPLRWGKSVQAMGPVLLNGWQHLRSHGHLGVSIEHYSWDRAGITALERYFRQWHSQRADAFGQLAQGDHTKESLTLSEFMVVTPCAAHDAHNAFRWALHCQFGSKELLRDCYVGIESLRKSHNLVEGNLAQWISDKLSFHSTHGPEWARQQE
eukprot:8215129-Lingulodinium_polyedra.AAC.1